MNSSVKIAYEGGHGRGPVIKFLVPSTGTQTPGYSQSEDQDEDPRDTLMRDFLHTPTMVDRNTLFRAATYFSTPKGDVTTIEPIVDLDDKMYCFRNTILNTHVPYDTIIELNRNGIPNRGIVQENLNWVDIDMYIKIHKFFDDLTGNTKAFSDKGEDKEELTQNVRNNSPKFREWLDSQNITWKPNEHMTTIIGNHDKYDLGFAFGKYYRENNPV